ncbi:MAG: S-methyl-5-thioribose-1-phosphate isomerase [Myxococcota bacterium]|nr:S-methyl-5-thioribose-1-phosphate isomerase [Myxococcota bacterium]
MQAQSLGADDKSIPISPLRWQESGDTLCVEMLDQRLLPRQELWLRYSDAQGVAEAIRTMVIRGAPAIGIAAAMGLALHARAWQPDGSQWLASFDQAATLLAGTRPTAVNLFWAIERMRAVALRLGSTPSREQAFLAMRAEALNILAEDVAMNRAIGEHGAAMLPAGARILTHCNAGALATGGYGTALGVIRACHERSKRDGTAPISVWVDETRPYLQGARLTAWELMQEGINATLISDNMAAFFMGRGEVDAVIIGADRIAANGDVANKIGSYGLAVLAAYHKLPFYVAAPSSTLDPKTASAAQIPIEERSAAELTQVGGIELAPEGISVRHPAFDLTPASLITAIVTEKGVFFPPYSFVSAS